MDGNEELSVPKGKSNNLCTLSHEITDSDATRKTRGSGADEVEGEEKSSTL